jgi:hypothetical protein
MLKNNKSAIVAAVVAVTLAMAIVPVPVTPSSITIVQSAWAEEIPEIDTDTDSLIAQYNVPDADNLIEEHTPPSVHRSDIVSGRISNTLAGITFVN